MKMLRTLAIVLASLPAAALAQPDRMFGSGIDQKCYDGANQAADLWKQQGIADATIQKQFQQYLAQCSGADPLTAAFAGAVNVDYFRLARLVVAAAIQPDLYVGLVRDRERKMRHALKSSGWLNAYIQGDADGDLIPNSMDRCAGTPDLTRTDDHGCPDLMPLAPQPSGTQMTRVFNKMKLTTSPACDGAVPAVSSPIRLAYWDFVRELWFAVTKASGQPPNCVVLYEVQVHMSQPWPGAPVAAEDLMTVVFRSTENIDMGPSGQARQVFRTTAKDTGVKLRLYQNVKYYQNVEFRVRAINGNGLSSGWSGSLGPNMIFDPFGPL